MTNLRQYQKDNREVMKSIQYDIANRLTAARPGKIIDDRIRQTDFGLRDGSLKDQGLIGKALYLPTLLVSSNLAAILGLYAFVTGKQTSPWKRARRRGESG